MKRIYVNFIYTAVFSVLIIFTPLFAAGSVFNEKAYGYTMHYPGDWTYVKKSLHEIIFMKKTGADLKTPVVGIQNLNSTKLKEGKFKDIDSVIEVFENQLKVTKHASIYPVETYVYDKKGKKVSGKQFIAEYVFKNNSYKQLVIVIPRTNGELFHVWIYSALTEQYDKYFSVIKKMLDSWTMTEE